MIKNQFIESFMEILSFQQEIVAGLNNSVLEKNVFGGYKCERVDEVISSSIKNVEKSMKILSSFSNDFKEMQSELIKYREMEVSIQQSLITANQMSAKIIEEAENKRDLILSECENKKNSILKSVNEDVENLKKVSSQEKEELEANLKEYENAISEKIDSLTKKYIVEKDNIEQEFIRQIKVISNEFQNQKNDFALKTIDERKKFEKAVEETKNNALELIDSVLKIERYYRFNEEEQD